jgi:hypothetical protein
MHGEDRHVGTLEESPGCSNQATGMLAFGGSCIATAGTQQHAAAPEIFQEEDVRARRLLARGLRPSRRSGGARFRGVRLAPRGQLFLVPRLVPVCFRLALCLHARKACLISTYSIIDLQLRYVIVV